MYNTLMLFRRIAASLCACSDMYRLAGADVYVVFRLSDKLFTPNSQMVATRNVSTEVNKRI